jgi:DNA-binding IclR family transcriptional regulator
MTTVAKALDLLTLFTRAQPQAGLSDLARRAGLNKATCHRLLTDLAAAGLVEQVGAGREYRLGPGVLRLAALREAAVPLQAAARPVLDWLAETTGETAHLSVLVAGRLQALAFAYSTRHATRVMMSDADVLPFHATASGLAVLGALDRAARDAVLAAPLPALTPLTVTDPAALRGIAACARAEGFAESIGGFEDDVHSLAVPLFGADGACFGALAVAAPKARMQPAAVLPALMQAAARITRQLGGQPPDDIAARWNAAA